MNEKMFDVQIRQGFNFKTFNLMKLKKNKNKKDYNLIYAERNN